jgi:DNA-binding PadR family transcriptional regulator
VDEKSIYRALKRFAETGLVISDFQPSEVGPPRRYFSLTHAGRTLLLNFIDRNILIFQAPAVVKALDRLGRETKRKE